MKERQTWIEPDGTLALSLQCKRLKVTRSVVYEQKKRTQEAVDEHESQLLRLLDEEYTQASLLWFTAHEEIPK